ncbi:MAG: SURF1 family protein [Caulobacteraceae bacterium]|nr:SURF1 family protein [Caulobacteraceae bacterium]
MMKSEGLAASAGGAAGKPGFPVVMTLFAALAFALLVSLGVWQVHRLHWKQDLLARIAALQQAPAEPLVVAMRRAADGVDVDYTRVQADCPLIEQTPFVRVYAVRDAQAGFRIITACALTGHPYGSILVDRGFIAQDDAAHLTPGVQTLRAPIIGVLRRGDRKTFVTPDNEPSQRLFYWRDIPAIARVLGVTNPAPTFLMLESPGPMAPGPIPAPVPTDIPNRHLEYAVTWFGLAAALLGVYLASLWRRRIG